MIRLISAVVCCVSFSVLLLAEKPRGESHPLVYADKSNPWYPHKDFPKLLTFRDATPEQLSALPRSPESLIINVDGLTVSEQAALKSVLENPAASGHPSIRRADGTHNGFFIHDRHFCWQSEDTAHPPDLIERVAFDDVLKQHRREESRKVLPPTPVGAAVIDITPNYPVRLTGYGNRTMESEGIAAKLHARALAIGARRVGPASNASAGPPKTAPHRSTAAALPPTCESPLAILITVDNCGVPIEITEAVFARIAAKHGLNRERFALSSTHSHSAPWLRGFAPNILAEIPEDHAAHLAQYEAELTQKLVAVVDNAIESQRPAYLASGFGEANFAMNRRTLQNGKWAAFGEVPDGPTDKRVPVLAAHDPDGNLIAVLANYACHCTTETGEFNQISGDWAGFAADQLEADHPGAVALIAIGCGADANPSPRGTHEQAKQHGRTIADEVNRMLAEAKREFLHAASSSHRPIPEGVIQGERNAVAGETAASASSPLIRPAATFSPDLGGEGTIRRINPEITCRMARVDLPLGPLPSREEWEQQASQPGVTGSRARYFLKMLDDGQAVPSTIPDYPVQTWCFGEDLAMVFLGGEVVVDYSIRMGEMFDSDRLWINAYSNDVPCYIASSRILREGGYEADASMVYYRRPTRLAPEAEDVLCDAVQKLMPHEFYSEDLQRDFPAPKSPEESLKTMTTKPDLKVVLAASEPLIRDPVAFDWDERGRLWVVEMGDYPRGERRLSPGLIANGMEQSEVIVGSSEAATSASSPLIRPAATFSPDLGGEGTGGGRVQILEDTDQDGVYDKATTFLDGLAFPNGIQCWRGGAIITMAPEIFYAEDTDSDGKADLRKTLYKGFVEGNQQHRVNGLRWGLDGWLYLANGDSGGEIVGTGLVPGQRSTSSPISKRKVLDQGAAASEGKATSASSPLIRPAATFSPDLGGEGTVARGPISLRGRDLRIDPDTNGLDTVSGQTQFGRERDDFGNWFGNNNSNPIFQYVLEDRYVRRNPHAGISGVTAQVAAIPGAAPVYPTSRTLARFNDFGFANRFTSACSTMIYRDTLLGEQYYGSAFTSEPVHNLVSRLVLTRDGFNFKGERAADEQQSEFLASTDNWFRPTMIRTGPDGALWVADMYRAVIEHPEWIPPEYQRKMDLYAGNDRGRIYRIVPAAQCCGNPTVDQPLRRLESEQPTSKSSGSVGGESQSGASSPLIRPAATFSPDLGGEGTAQVSSGSLQDQRSWFPQSWNEIPIADLVSRLESPNGWWRDTAQRILMHRGSDALNDAATLSRVRDLAMHGQTAAVRVQSLAILTTLSTPEASKAVLQSLKSDFPEVRRRAIEQLEESLRQGDVESIGHLIPLADDQDDAVRLQLMLTLGEAKGHTGAALLGQMLRQNADVPFMRSAGLTSLTPDNIGGVLKEALNAPDDGLNENLVGILLAQAAAMGKTDQLIEPMTVLVESVAANPAAARFELVGKTLEGVLRNDGASLLKMNDRFHAALKMANDVAIQIARDSSAPPENRASAIRFEVIAEQVDSQSMDLTEFFSPQTPGPVQLAAISAVGQSEDLKGISKLLGRWSSLAPAVRAEFVSTLVRRESTTHLLLDGIETSTGAMSSTDLDASQRDALLNHRNIKIAERAKELFTGELPSTRQEVVNSYRNQLAALKGNSMAGRTVFEKRCGICHRLQEIGKEIGADLAALKDRSTDALLTAVLDPNRAIESRFLVYTVATKDGLQQSGMLKSETGGSLTLIGSDGKELTVARADIEELVASKRSLMPEGLEKDLSAQDLADVLAFVQSTGTPWKRFDGNSPTFVAADADGTVTLPASAAEIYGPSLVFEQKYGNLGFWSSTDDYARWTFEVPKSGHWTVEFDFACDDSAAGSLIKFSTGNRMLTARVPGSGTWDHYQTWKAGTIDLHRGRGQLIITAPERPPFALIDLRAVRLIPPQ
jgi:putative membrane-bound dehydrogenase-like protein